MTLNDVKVGYCTNVHAGSDYARTLANLDQYATAVRSIVCPDEVLPVGLWLSARAVREVINGERIDELKQFLTERGLNVFTINGFPYGDFHQAVVKHQVYQPDWHDDKRLSYTVDLANVLAHLLNEGDEGGISTLPVGWGKTHYDDERVVGQLLALIDELKRIEDQTGRCIHVDIEPEPGCLIDTADDVIRLFGLLASRCEDETLLRRHLRVCHDICHAAVMFEDQVRVLEQYRMAGIATGKVQVSSAIEADFDRAGTDGGAMMLQLQKFSEPKYLHQTTVKRATSTVFYEDLDIAIDKNQPGGTWRTHFHVPVYLDQVGMLATTKSVVVECLKHIIRNDLVKDLEVETYAWNVLPQDVGEDDLAEGIAREIQWVRDVVTGKA